MNTLIIDWNQHTYSKKILTVKKFGLAWEIEESIWIVM